MILRLVCSPKQVDNIFNAHPNGGNPQCTTSQLKDPKEVNCACCMLDDTYVMLKTQHGGAEPAYTNCNTYFDDSGVPMSVLNLLAYLDNGVAIKESGDEKFDGSGSSFTADYFGLEKFYTPIIQTHSVNELLFGYPSVGIGLFLPTSLLPSALDASDSGLTT